MSPESSPCALHVLLVLSLLVPLGSVLWSTAARAAHVEERLSVSQRDAGTPTASAAEEEAGAQGADDNAEAKTADIASGRPSLSSVPPDVLQQLDAEAGEGQRRPFQPQEEEGAGAP